MPEFASPSKDDRAARSKERGCFFAFLAIGICAVQAGLMAIGATSLLLYEPGAVFVRENLRFLQDYVPMFARYGAIFAANGRETDFLPFVSVYLFYLALEGLVLICLLICLAVSIFSLRNERPERFGFWKNVGMLALLCFFAIPIADLVFGLSDIKRPGLFQNGLLYGNYVTAVYMFCLTLPFCNFFFYLFMLARFTEQRLTRRTELEPVKNPDRVWKIDQAGRDIE